MEQRAGPSLDPHQANIDDATPHRSGAKRV
jgi:hypothetical protein